MEERVFQEYKPSMVPHITASFGGDLKSPSHVHPFSDFLRG